MRQTKFLLDSIRKWQVQAVILSVAVALIIVTLYKRQPESLEVVAREVVTAYETGNGKVIFDRLWPQEQSSNQLSPSDVQQILDEIVKHRLKLVQEQCTVEKWSQMNTYQGVAGIDFTSPKGNKYDFSADAMEYEGKARSNLGNAIISSWIWSYLAERDLPYSRANMKLAVLRGFEEDMPILDRAGFKYFVSPNYDNGQIVIRSSQELLALYEKMPTKE